MSGSEVLIWLAIAAVVIAVAVQVWLSLSLAAERREHRRWCRLAGFDSCLQPMWAQGAKSTRMAPERARAVRRQAEYAARRTHATGGGVPNPYGPGTQEYVLWLVSYQLALTEFADEEQQDAPLRPGTGPHDVSPSRL